MLKPLFLRGRTKGRRGRTRSRQALMSAGLPAVLLAGLVVPTTTPAAAKTKSDEPSDIEQTISWETCYGDVTEVTGQAYECGALEVPLDYDRPKSGSITVEMVKVPAADQENRIGSVLLNPGGPGGSGIDFALGFGPFAGDALGAEVADRFDLIGFDPRGIGLSTPILCYPSIDEAVEGQAPVAFPLNAEEEREIYRADASLARNCRRNAGPIASHMSTANVARDMDQIREALGEDQLNFLGLSYGTFVGSTYANLFPDRVRSVVLDGVLNPEEWVNKQGKVPVSAAIRSDKGAQDTLDSFFAACEAAATGNCALAPGAEGRFDALAERLKAEPAEIVDLETGETFTVTYQDLTGVTLSFLYNPYAYGFLAEILVDLETLTEPTALPVDPVVAQRLTKSMSEQEFYFNDIEGFPAVTCTDSNNPRNPRAWSKAGEAADEEFGYFGNQWTWLSSACALWPFEDKDRYTGPFTATTANPVLIIGNRYDPATRYEAAQGTRDLMPNSALLTVEASGHTSLGINECAGKITGQYLLDPTTATAVDGTTCESEFNPFDLVIPDSIPADESPSDGELVTAEAAEVREVVVEESLVATGPVAQR